MTAGITVAYALHAELTFYVLSHVDLGQDAASIFRAGLPRRPWVRGLLQAYQAAPARLTVHAAAMHADGLEQLLEQLTRGQVAGLERGPGLDLACRLAAALEAEQARVRQRWQAEQATAAEQTAWLQRDPALPALRQALRDGARPPPLRLLHCPALAHPPGTRGRGTTRQGQVVLAACLTAAPDQLLCQLLHEEAHLVTDAAEPTAPGQRQDTRPGSPGLELHLRLERRAVEAGQRAVDSAAPALAGPYRKWRRRHNM